MTIVQLAEHVLMNVRLKQSVKVIFIKLILTSAQIVVLVLMFVRLKQFLPHNSQDIFEKGQQKVLVFFYSLKSLSQ